MSMQEEMQRCQLKLMQLSVEREESANRTQRSMEKEQQTRAETAELRKAQARIDLEVSQITLQHVKQAADAAKVMDLKVPLSS